MQDCDWPSSESAICASSMPAVLTCVPACKGAATFADESRKHVLEWNRGLAVD
jgi:hypothetical protein